MNRPNNNIKILYKPILFLILFQLDNKLIGIIITVNNTKYNEILSKPNDKL